MMYVWVTLALIVSSIVYLKLAMKYRIIDKPNLRSSHTKITVRGGGIIFSIAILLFSLTHNFQFPYFTAGVVIVSIISFLDDIYTLSAKLRFPIQLLAVVFVLYELAVPLDVLLVLYLFIGVSMVNLFNFMDGINGITGIYAMTVLLVFYGVNLEEHIINADLMTYSFISLLVFGFYNFRKKALFFAGDIGSVTIGLLFFFLNLYFALALKAPLLFLSIGVFGADTGLTFLYRKIYTKESVFEPHRHHVYQKLVDVKKMSHLKVSLMYGVLQLLINFFIYKNYQLQIETQWLFLGGFILVATLIYTLLFRMLKSKK